MLCPICQQAMPPLTGIYLVSGKYLKVDDTIHTLGPISYGIMALLIKYRTGLDMEVIFNTVYSTIPNPPYHRSVYNHIIKLRRKVRPYYEIYSAYGSNFFILRRVRHESL